MHLKNNIVQDELLFFPAALMQGLYSEGSQYMVGFFFLIEI